MIEGPGDTICAVASPPGGAERGVVRVSGPAAARVVGPALGLREEVLRERARGAFRARFEDGRGGLPALVLWMPGPHSYTGEDVVELHLPGATPLLERALEALLERGARPARAGEFTRRAFESGRIDLTRAEGVAELARARGEQERRAALALLLGGLADRVDALRDDLEDLCSLCEASLDFDESDAGHVSMGEITARADALLARLDDAVAWEAARPARGAAATVVLLGPPNAGKSTLFNRLAHARAITSPVAGTTRDALVARIELGGTALDVVDLPGFGPPASDVDARAQALAAAHLARADAVVLVLDAGTEPTEPGAWLGRAPTDAPRVLAWNQVDRAGVPAAPPEGLAATLGALRWHPTSGRCGTGLAALGDDLVDLVRGVGDGPSGLSLDVAGRHRRGFVAARLGLAQARRCAEADWPLDVVATELRGALGALDAVTGRTGPEDLLDRVFARFCLGK